MRRVQIEEFLLQSKNGLLLDVRSPGEYNHACMPGAVRFPLFTDEERKVVGTAYKQQSRETAIKIGLDYFGPKMRGMVEEVEKNIEQMKKEQMNELQQQAPNSKPQIFIYCWRGGMRSGAVAWLLNLYGFNVTVLSGGYKAFRNYVLKSFEQPYSIKILGGYTGSGKTEVLQQLKQNGEKIIDLENLASHKGSAFGNINMPTQPTQEMFENKLSFELSAASCRQNGEPIDDSYIFGAAPNPKLQTPTHFIWLEDESQRIGTVNIPKAFWQTMRTAPVYFLEIPFEERLNHINEEYGQCDKENLLDAIDRIKKRLGPVETKNAIQCLEEGNTKECFRILLHYYDKHYLKGLQNREELSSLLTKIVCEKVTAENAGSLSQTQSSSAYAGTA
jgi:tRNA 2-selenouridine synthase